MRHRDEQEDRRPRRQPYPGATGTPAGPATRQAGTPAAGVARDRAAPGGSPALLGTPSGVLWAQRAAGNTATAHVMRLFGEERPPAQIVADAISNRSVSDAKSSVLRAEGYRSATEEQRLQLIDILLGQGWVGPIDEYALEALWDSFGSRIPEIWAADGGKRWKACADAGAELSRIRALRGPMADFAIDVHALARGYLDDNQRFVDDEWQRLGLPEDRAELPPGGVPEETADAGVPAGPRTDPAAAEARLAEVEQLAAMGVRAKQVRRHLLGTVVGTVTEDVPVPLSGGGGTVPVTSLASFDPMGPPQEAADAAAIASGRARPWDEVNEDFQLVNAIIAGIGARSPAVYAAMQQDREEQLADPAIARGAAIASLREVRGNIANAYQRFGSLDYRDMVPLQEQLFAGTRAATGTDWSKDFYRAMMAAELETHSVEQMLATLGLATLEAAAFILSDLATGGLATVAWIGVGVAAGAVQVANSWDRALTLSAAAGSAASPDRELIATGQAEAAQIQAVLDTLALAVNLAGAAGSVVKVAKMTRQAARIESLIDELGVAGAVSRTGRTPEELLTLVGKDSRHARAIEDHMVDEAFAKLERGEIAQEGGRVQISRRGDPMKIPDVGRGVSPDLPARVRTVTGKTISQAPEEVQQAWRSAVAQVTKNLEGDTSKEAMLAAYKKAVTPFWQNVRANPAARGWFEANGFWFDEAASGAPYIEAIRNLPRTRTLEQELRVSLDHILEKAANPARALDPGNLRFVCQWDNWLLAQLGRRMP